MSAKLRSRLSYSNVMATVAVFVALGGTSYALATGSVGSREIANNSVRSKDLRKNGVRGKDVRNGTIGTRDVADGGLLAADFKAGQLPGGERGEPGPPATKLFAYIRDTAMVDATVQYGSGVTGVTEPAVIGNPYDVTSTEALRIASSRLRRASATPRAAARTTMRSPSSRWRVTRSPSRGKTTRARSWTPPS